MICSVVWYPLVEFLSLFIRKDMDSLTPQERKRAAIFYLGCIPIRSLTVAVAVMFPEYAWVVGVMYVVFAVGLAWRLINHKASDRGGFGGSVWWNSMRPVHIVLWLLFAVLVARKDERAWIPLVLDITLSLVGTTDHYFVRPKQVVIL